MRTLRTFILLIPLANAPGQTPGVDGLPSDWETAIEAAAATVMEELMSGSEGSLPTETVEAIRDRIDRTPPGAWMGRIPGDLYLQLAQGEPGATALALVRQWEDSGPPPDMDPTGRLRFDFAAGVPVIMVTPLQLAQIDLEPGERVLNAFLGDTVRWSVEITSAGDPPTPGLVVKAAETNLTTGLVISTDRRTYRLQLVSSSVFHMPSVGFSYPDTDPLAPLRQELAAFRERIASRLAAQEVMNAEVRAALDARNPEAAPPPGTGRTPTALPPARLDFGYRIKGRESIPWFPRAVYNDGARTYIVLPKDVAVRQAPVVLIRHRRKNELVNFRLLGDRFVVDRLADRLVLVSGAGFWRREKVTIERH